MNPLAIYSKTGKGVQEASGKTRELSRADRAVLAAIDGRSTVAEVAQRLNRSANDAKLLQLFERLERTGFVRLIAGGAAPVSRPASSAPSSRGRSALPPSKDSTGADLDFTQSLSVPRSSTPPADLAALARATADRKAAEEASLKSFSDAARQRAEAEAQARAQREAAQRAAAEAKAREEAEAARARSEMQQRARREADDKARLEAELLAKIAEAERLAKEAEERSRREAQAKAQEAAARQAREEAERKAKEDAERRAREEAQRRAKEEAERKAKEEAERKAKEQAERRAKEEAERRAQEEAERRAKEEAERKAKEEAERRAKEEAERKAKEEAERRAREEAERRAEEEAERKAKEQAERKAKEEAERRAKEEAERKAKEEAERRAREEAERKAKEEAERRAKEEAERKAKEEAERRAREEAERKAKEEAERKAKEEAERKAMEQAERKAKEEAERRAKEEAERKAKEEAERRAREEAERKAKEEAERKAKEEAERKAKEEAERKAKEEAERKAKEEAERKAREEAERQATEEAQHQSEGEAKHQAQDDAVEPAADLSDSLLADLDAFSARDEATREAAEREAEEAAARQAGEAAEQRRREEREREAEEARRVEAERLEPVARVSESTSQPLPEAQESSVGGKAKRRLAAIVATDVVGYSRMMGIDEEGTLSRFKTLVNEIVRPKVEEHGGNIFKTLGDGLLIEFRSVVDAVRWAVEVQTAVANDQAERSLAQRILFRMGVNLGDVIDDDHDIFGDGVNVAARLEASAERGGICISGVVYDQVQDKVSCKFEDLGKQKLKNIARPVRMYRLHGDWETVALRRTTDVGTLPTAAATRALEDDVEVREEDLDMEDVKRDERALSPRAREEARERSREKKRLARAEEEAPRRVQRPRKWGKPTALTLLVIVVAAVGIAPFVPISPVSYEQAASATLGAPVRIGSAHLSLFTGLHLYFERVAIGAGVKIGKVTVTPTIGSLFGGPKVLRQIVLDNVVAREDALGDVLFGHLRSDRLEVRRVELKKLRLTGPLELPPLDAQLSLAGHALRLARVQGPGGLSVTLRPSGDGVHFDATANSFAPPFVPAFNLTNYAMSGAVTRSGMSVKHFDAQVYGGTLAGTVRIRWTKGWNVEGELKVDGINAGVFAPALVSQGTAQAKGNFAMIGPNPSKLLDSAHLSGRFSISQGVLSSFDLAQAIRSKGQNVTGFTRFAKMSGRGIYDSGSIALRNVEISAGALSAGAGADISPSGALSGRIIADVETADGRTLSVTLDLAGTVTTPRVHGH